jgi:hypothetical protein
MIHPAIWDIAMLNNMMTECRTRARADPSGDWWVFPAEQEAMLHGFDPTELCSGTPKRPAQK